MKKVFLSLAVIAALTVVSCKQSENAAEGTADTTAVADTTAAPADTTAAPADTTAAPADTTAAPAEAAAPAKK